MLSCIDLSFYADAALNTHFERIGAHKYTAGSGFTTEGTIVTQLFFVTATLILLRKSKKDNVMFN